jgi:hypothetical protein
VDQPESGAQEIPPSNPDYGNQTSKVGIPAQVNQAKKQAVELGPDAPLEIGPQQFHFGSAAGANQ